MTTTELYTPDNPPPPEVSERLLAVTIDQTLPPPNWLQALSYSANVDRYVLAAVFAGQTGVLNGLAVAQRAAGANMTVDIALGQAVINGSDIAAQGSYLVRLLGTYNVPVSAAPGAGLTRIDRVVAQVNDPAATGSGTAGWGLGVVAGAAVSSNPVPPAAPASSVTLAFITVAAGTASITSALIADQRSSLAQLGRVLPPPLAAGAPISSYTAPDGEVWVAKGGQLNGAWRRARDVVHVKVGRALAMTAPTSFSGPMQYDGAVDDVLGLWNAVSVFYIAAPVAGLYHLTTTFSVYPNQYTIISAAIQNSNGAVYLASTNKRAANQGAVDSLVCVTTARLAAGDLVAAYAACSDAGLNVAADSNRSNNQFTFDYIGTGA